MYEPACIQSNHGSRPKEHAAVTSTHCLAYTCNTGEPAVGTHLPCFSLLFSPFFQFLLPDEITFTQLTGDRFAS